MQEPVDSKIFSPRIPMLSHLIVVKLALKLLDNFKYHTLENAFCYIQKGEITPLPKDSDEPKPPKRQRTSQCPSQMHSLLYLYEAIEEERVKNESIEDRNLELIQCSKAHEKILQIPYFLRRRVMQAVRGLNYVSGVWKRGHLLLLKLPDHIEFTFHWRQDGTLDEIKTAQEIVTNSEIDIVKRFRLACLYSLEENIKDLWHQMEENGGTENLVRGRISTVPFWNRYMREGCVVPWKLAVQKHFRCRRNRRGEVRFGTFLPSLPQEERWMFLSCLKNAHADDIRTCMYAMSSGEEERVLYSGRFCPGDLLSSFLRWPMQSFFLETAGKMLRYIDVKTFHRLLNDILYAMHVREDFDYAGLLESFWELVPRHLREAMREGRYSNVNIHIWSDKVKRKRRHSCDVEDKFFKK